VLPPIAIQSVPELAIAAKGVRQQLPISTKPATPSPSDWASESRILATVEEAPRRI
jgi:hypothetical protein